MTQRFVVHSLQFGGWRVGVGCSLEIRDEPVRGIAIAENVHASFDLGTDGRSRKPSVGAETSVVAIDAAANCNGAIHIRASEARIDRYAINLGSESFAQESAKGVVSPLGSEF